MVRWFSPGLLALGLAVMAAGCIGPFEFYRNRELSPDGSCQAVVTGVGSVAIEEVYLPAVVSCENGAAAAEALKAQAIAARSYLYYKLGTAGAIADGPVDQVFTCSWPPTEAHYAAAAATAGQVLRYRDTQVAGFFVAGALQAPPECRGGVDDPTATEPFVTDNQGRSSIEVTQTPLGFVAPENFANRGCLSQNGASCLADAGASAEEIVRRYYGEDIDLELADPPCPQNDPR
jgi:hypothetical protein